MVADSHGVDDDLDLYRREALGAFAHEVRTPLTSIRMVLELARRDSQGDTLMLDGELAAMLTAAIDDLQSLADDLQEASRLERRKAALSLGPCDLQAAFATAAELLSPDIAIDGELPPAVAGPWDAGRLVRALAGFAKSANRIGDGSGVVRTSTRLLPEEVVVELTSGWRGHEVRAIAADAGFAFFRSRQFILAMGGRVQWERTERHLLVRTFLPR